ncbi:hypothetical protein LI951_04495 [Enterococcus sp. BWT-B8]|uniref:hypothetical protein n=1 Tax=Enterococcus sp. BWT-B8 TaxID=2885157 RepID=UPI001E297A2E|nr:hypothetical protein [Enterococcus sp. BWT-B8]MCB5951318.1 hypothetical protein [Enterococcus sp. BWT-B8]
MELDTTLIEALLASPVSSYQISMGTGISRQMIGKLRNGQADFHKGSLENALSLYSFALEQKKIGNLLMNKNETLKEVATKDDLLDALKRKTDEILVIGELAAEINELKKNQLTDTEIMGVELGGGGMLTILEYLISLLIDAGEKINKNEKAIRKKIIRLYYIKRVGPASVLLRLKQLDY